MTAFAAGAYVTALTVPWTSATEAISLSTWNGLFRRVHEWSCMAGRAWHGLARSGEHWRRQASQARTRGECSAFVRQAFAGMERIRHERNAPDGNSRRGKSGTSLERSGRERTRIAGEERRFGVQENGKQRQRRPGCVRFGSKLQGAVWMFYRDVQQ